jgi:hypothetical protein
MHSNGEPDSPLFSFAASAQPSQARRSIQQQQLEQQRQTLAAAPSQQMQRASLRPSALSVPAPLDELHEAVLVDPARGLSLALDPSHVQMLRSVYGSFAHLALGAILAALQAHEVDAEIDAHAFQSALDTLLLPSPARSSKSSAGAAANTQAALRHLHAIFDLFASSESGGQCADVIELSVGLSVLCERASADAKLRFAFQLFDSGSRGRLEQTELAEMLAAFLTTLLPDSEPTTRTHLHSVMAQWTPVLFEHAQTLDEEAGEDDEDGDEDKPASISYSACARMMDELAPVVPALAIVLRLLTPGAPLFGSNVHYGNTPKHKQAQSQAARASFRDHAEEQNGFDEQEEDEEVFAEEDAEPSDDGYATPPPDARFAFGVSSSPIQSPQSPTSSMSDLESYILPAAKAAFQAARRFPSYDEYKATGDASAWVLDPKAAKGRGAFVRDSELDQMAGLRTGSEGSNDGEDDEYDAYGSSSANASGMASPQSEHRAFLAEARRQREEDEARLLAQRARQQQSHHPHHARTSSQSSMGSTSHPQHHRSSPSRKWAKRSRGADINTEAAQQFSELAKAAEVDPQVQITLFKLFARQQQANYVIQQAAQRTSQQPQQQQRSTATAAASGPPPLSLGATRRPASAGSVPAPASAPAQSPQPPAQHALQATSVSLSLAAAPPAEQEQQQQQHPDASPLAQKAPLVPLTLDFSVQDLTDLQSLLALLLSLGATHGSSSRSSSSGPAPVSSPKDGSVLPPAAAILHALEPSIVFAQGDRARAHPLVPGDKFYRAMIGLIAERQQKKQQQQQQKQQTRQSLEQEHEATSHLVACMLVAFQDDDEEEDDGDDGRAGTAGFLCLSDFLLAVAAWSEPHWRASFRMVAGVTNAAGGSPSAGSTSSARINRAQLETLFCCCLRLLLCAHTGLQGALGRGQFRSLVVAAARASADAFFPVADAHGTGRVSFKDFSRVRLRYPTLVPWLGLMHATQARAGLQTRGPVLASPTASRPTSATRQQPISTAAAVTGAGQKQRRPASATYPVRTAYEKQQLSRGYTALHEQRQQSDDDGVFASSSEAASSSGDEADASSPASPQRASGGARTMARSVNTNGGSVESQQQRQQQPPQRRSSPIRDAIQAALAQRRASGSSNAGFESDEGSSARFASGSSGGSGSSSPRTPPRRPGQQSQNGSSRRTASGRHSSRTKKRTGPHTLSVAPFEITMSMHKQPSPRALLSAVKVKPLPVFTLPSHAPKLLLCIPLHADEAAESKHAQQALGVPSPGVRSGVSGSVQSLKVYDSDLPAFTFFKTRLAEVCSRNNSGSDDAEADPGQVLWNWAEECARSSAASANARARSSPNKLDQTLSVFNTRLSRLEFAACLRALLQPLGGNEESAAAHAHAEQLSQYTVSLFRTLDHSSRGSVLLGEVLLGLSLFLPFPSADDKLRFAYRVLLREQDNILAAAGESTASPNKLAAGSGDAAVEGLRELSLRPFYRSVYSLLTALCSTHFRMSVPSRPVTPASARTGNDASSAMTPLSPSSLHSLPHELMQARLESTARKETSELFRLARTGVLAQVTQQQRQQQDGHTATAASSSIPSATAFRLTEDAFIAVTREHRHLLSFLNVLELDAVFSPKNDAQQSPQQTTAVSLGAAAEQAQRSPSSGGSARAQQAAFESALRQASPSATRASASGASFSSFNSSPLTTPMLLRRAASTASSAVDEEIEAPNTQGRAQAKLRQQQRAQQEQELMRTWQAQLATQQQRRSSGGVGSFAPMGSPSSVAPPRPFV